MGQTIAEKIISRHSGKNVKAGEIVISDVDFCFGQDGTGGRIIDSFKKLGTEEIISREIFSMVLDHSAPSPNIGVSEIHKKIRNFSRRYGIKLFDIGAGICHQIFPEKGYVVPGDLVLGADSHTCTYGALNAFSAGVGATDIAITLASGKNWLKVPESMKIILEGQLSKGVYSKDVSLSIIKDIGVDGANYKSIEFYGKVIHDLSMEGRFTLSNMAVEMGAKCGVMKTDKKTMDWVKRYSDKKPVPAEADDDAKYTEVREYDLSDLSPQVALPDSVNNVVSIEDTGEIPIQQVFIGTCTNGRLEDMGITASILKGKHVARGVKLIITPASRKIFLASLKKGYIDIFIKSGAVVNNPGCGPCVGTHQGVLADGENAFSTGNRNFRGRMGNPNANIYLGSPATAAATAITGFIADPREHKRRL